MNEETPVYRTHPTSQGRITPADLAAQFNLKREESQQRWKGQNPFPGAEPGRDRFVLRDNGSGHDFHIDREYTSREVAQLSGIGPDEYGPYAEWRERNRKVSSGHQNGPAAPPDTKRAPKAPFDWALATIYNYHDENGALLFQVGRCDDRGCEKSIRQRRPDRQGGYVYNLEGVRRVLYNLPDVMQAQSVYICEGEKVVHRLNDELHKAGTYGEFVATTNPQGAGKWRDEYADVLHGKAVAVLPDNDKTGREHAETVCESLIGRVLSVRVVALPDLPPKGDVCDFLDAQGTMEQITALLDAAPDWTPAIGVKGPQKHGQAPATAFALDEIGNGARFAHEHGDDLRFCSVREQWQIYKGGRWQLDLYGEAERRAKQTGRDLAAEAARETEDDKRARLLKHAITLTKRSARETMLKDAASEPGMMVTPEQFDADPHLFNLTNGTLDLRTLDFHSHRRDDLLTHLAPVAYDPDAACPTWCACLARWLPAQETRDFVQDYVGVSLRGVPVDESWAFLYGDGANGKSTFVRVLEWLCGDYSHKAQAETFMDTPRDRDRGKPAPELLALKGKRLVTVQETAQRHRLNEALIKDLTGRDSITARGLYSKVETTFIPQFTLWMFGNHKPQIKDTSAGTWRRIRLIPFTQTIAESERDTHLADKLHAELPGILNWALTGLRRVEEQGLNIPDTVRAATREYQSEQDTFKTFIDDCTVTGQEVSATFSELWEAWRAWCLSNGEKEGVTRTFGQELTRRGFQEAKITRAAKQVRGRRGIGVKLP